MVMVVQSWVVRRAWGPIYIPEILTSLLSTDQHNDLNKSYIISLEIHSVDNE